MAGRSPALGYALLSLLMGAQPSWADVVNPDGQTIPLVNRVGPVLNSATFNEGIDYRKDASVEPQQFAPLCGFQAQYVYKGGGAKFAVGWYNVDDQRASSDPPRFPADINALFGCDTVVPESQILSPPRVFDASDIQRSAAYKGGLIGFALVPCNPNDSGANQYHYSERRFNTVCTACAKQEPWISSLIYKSKKIDNAFYMGFEDLNVSASSYGSNDGDYEDFLFLFKGLTCPGGGEPCPVPGKQGVCSVGVSECGQGGGTTCKQVIQPEAAERCDGLDNNCDGQVDEGAPCPAGSVCDRGRCTTLCGQEFPCLGGLTCLAGRCVDPACANKTCPADQACRLGQCVSPCEGIVCPAPQLCRVGRCVDPCAGVRCDAGKVCQGGACVFSCDCKACAAGKACATTGQCVDPGCERMTCAAGDVCVAGQCRASCEAARCPAGQRCEAGQCLELAVDMAAPAMNDLSGTQEPPGGGVATGGCACRAGGPGADLSLLALGLYGLLGALGRRRRLR